MKTKGNWWSNKKQATMDSRIKSLLKGEIISIELMLKDGARVTVLADVYDGLEFITDDSSFNVDSVDNIKGLTEFIVAYDRAKRLDQKTESNSK